MDASASGLPGLGRQVFRRLRGQTAVLAQTSLSLGLRMPGDAADCGVGGAVLHPGSDQCQQLPCHGQLGLPRPSGY